MQVGELVLLAADVACKDIFECLWEAVPGSGGALLGLLLLVRLLFMTLLRCQVLLLLVLVGIGDVLLVWLFTRVRFCGANCELMDFEGVRVFSRGGAHTEIVAFWEFDLKQHLVSSMTFEVKEWLEHTLSVLKHVAPSTITSRNPSA